ncbi:MAG: TIM barrel protein [Saprospiraceae bacterium]
MNRRKYIKSSSLGLIGLWTLQNTSLKHAILSINKSHPSNIKHSVSRWCYQSLSLEILTDFCVEKGIQSIELLEPEEYQYVIKNGLSCAVANGPSSHITQGFNEPNLHEYLLAEYTKLIPLAADYGIPNIICFSGNKRGLNDLEGLENCAKGLDKVVNLAEKYNINLIMELLNSKVDHKDYQCDHTDWGVQLVKKVSSERFKLLYDIYHMQIMEGNIIETIQQNIQYIGHFHTAGVPGRHDLDKNQELNYEAIFHAIKKTGYREYIGQEFLPIKPNPLESLMDSILLLEQS